MKTKYSFSSRPITSLSHCWGGDLSHSCLQNSFNSATLEGFWAWTDHFKSSQNISIRFKSGLCQGSSKTFILFPFEPFRGELVLWIIVLLHNPTALEHQITGWWPDNTPSEFPVREQNSWLLQLWQVTHNKKRHPNTITLHTPMLVWCSHVRCNRIQQVQLVHRTLSQKNSGSLMCCGGYFSWKKASLNTMIIDAYHCLPCEKFEGGKYIFTFFCIIEL